MTWEMTWKLLTISLVCLVTGYLLDELAGLPELSRTFAVLVLVIWFGIGAAWAVTWVLA